MYIKTKKCSFWCNDNNCSHVGKICTFSYGKVKDIFGIRIKFHLGRGKGRGKREYGGEAQNEGYFCKIPIIKQDRNYLTNCWSDKLLITTIVTGMPKNLIAGSFK